jgi:hypothetical protein
MWRAERGLFAQLRVELGMARSARWAKANRAHRRSALVGAHQRRGCAYVTVDGRAKLVDRRAGFEVDGLIQRVQRELVVVRTMPRRGTRAPIRRWCRSRCGRVGPRDRHRVRDARWTDRSPMPPSARRFRRARRDPHRPTRARRRRWAPRSSAAPAAAPCRHTCTHVGSGRLLRSSGSSDPSPATIGALVRGSARRTAELASDAVAPITSE